MPGFLPFSRGSFSLDLIAMAMVLVIPALTASLIVVKIKKNYLLHKRLQLSIASLLAFVLLVFEIDLRIYGWKHLASASPFSEEALNFALKVHLVMAVDFDGWGCIAPYG
jgi:putative membrane protein